MSNNVPVNTLETSLTIVETLKEQGNATLTELAEGVDLPKSTVFNHAKTLEQNEFLVRTTGSARSSPGNSKTPRTSSNSSSRIRSR